MSTSSPVYSGQLKGWARLPGNGSCLSRRRRDLNSGGADVEHFLIQCPVSWSSAFYRYLDVGPRRNTCVTTTIQSQAHHHRLLGERRGREIVRLRSGRSFVVRLESEYPSGNFGCGFDRTFDSTDARLGRPPCTSKYRWLGSRLCRWRRGEAGMHERCVFAEEER